MFKVFDNVNDVVVTVYGVREDDLGTYFLVYSFDVWHWVSAKYYTPVE